VVRITGCETKRIASATGIADHFNVCFSFEFLEMQDFWLQKKIEQDTNRLVRLGGYG
jgi:hypothetical protein